MTQFTSALIIPLTSAKFLLQQKRLLPYALIPFFLNVIACVITFFATFYYLVGILQERLAEFNAWYIIALLYGLFVLVFLLLIGLIYFLFIILVNIIAAPFNDILSEKTYAVLSGKEETKPFSFKEFFGDSKRIILNELKKAGCFILIFFLILTLNFLPLIGSVAALGGTIIFAVWALAYEFLDYRLDRRRMSFREKRGFISRHRGLALGLGSGIYLLFLIPFINFLVIPLAVVGATRCYYLIEQELEGV